MQIGLVQFFLGRGVCVAAMVVAGPRKGIYSLFLLVFGHYSFSLTLFSLST
jgi:hypothetical protein